MRQVALPQIGESGQIRLRNAHIVVIGAGGLGCPALQYLTAAGIGKLTVVDFDRVEASNLNRQILFSPDDVGAFKAEVAARKLRVQNPDSRFEVHTTTFDKTLGDALLPDCDVVLDCTDRPDARYAINDACVEHDKPFIYAGIHRFEGQLAVFNFKGSATYRCAFPETENADLGGTCADNGVLGTVPGILGVMQANEAIKLIATPENVAVNRLLLLNFLTNEFKTIQLKRSPETPKTMNEPIIRDISPETLRNELDSGHQFYFLDVREPFEMRAPEAFGGDQIPTRRWDADRAVELLSANENPVVFCQHGVRSRAVIASLPRDLQQKVLNLQGGLAAFLELEKTHKS